MKKNTDLCNVRSALRLGASCALAWLLLSIVGASAWADGGGSGSGTPGDEGFAPGEEGGSLPIVDDTHGLTLVGRVVDLRSLAMTIQGRGHIDLVRLGGGVVALTFVGDYRIEVDRAALVRSNVNVLFRGGAAFRDGIALLKIGSSTPVPQDAERVPLPVARIASSPRAQGTLMTLDVQARGHQAFIAADFGPARIALTQRML